MPGTAAAMLAASVRSVDAPLGHERPPQTLLVGRLPARRRAAMAPATAPLSLGEEHPVTDKTNASDPTDESTRT